MMRARTNGVKRPCGYCSTLTVFELEETTPRGRHVRWLNCCVDCGGDSARRAYYLKLKEGAAA